MSNVVMRFPNWRSKAFTMSYDDGKFQDIEVVKKMKANGIKGTFNLNGGFYTDEDATEYGQLLSKKQMKELYIPNGMEVAVHGFTHPFLESLDTVSMIAEIEKDRKALEDLTGGIVRGMAYPFGTYNDTVVEVLRLMGIAYSRTTEAINYSFLPKDWLRLPSTCHHMNGKVFEYIENFKKLSLVDEDSVVTYPCRMLYIWGHSYELDSDEAWDWFDKIIADIAHIDEIWYATNIEIYDYCEAFKRLRFNVDHTVIENPTTTDLYFYRDGVKYMVKSGEALRI